MTKQGVLLINLGSPDSTSVPDVRRYLNQFLMDGRVIDVAWPLRRFIVGMILIKRPKESAHAYSRIWTKEGSPLVATSRHVRNDLQRRLGASIPVELAMRYQNPSIESAITKLRDQGVSDLLVFLLFPHYAMSSFETAAVRAQEVAAKIAPGMQVKIAEPYYDDPEFIAALAASAQEWLAKDFDHLLFSFHGLPERHLRKSDPTGCHCLATPDCCEKPSPAHRTCYRAQCFATVRAFNAAANVPAGKYSVAFQSRLGNDPWLQPFTDTEIVRLAGTGIKKLLVICPAFVSDCLETLEEIDMRGREDFLEAGGSEFALIPCMNEHPRWLEALEQMVRRKLSS